MKIIRYGMRIIEAVEKADIVAAVGRKTDAQLRKAFVGNVIATALLLRIGDENVAKQYKGKHLTSYSTLMHSAPRAIFWGMVLKNLSKSGNPELKKLEKDWSNFTSSRLNKIFTVLGQGIDFNDNEMTDVLRAVVNVLGQHTDSRAEAGRVGVFGWERLNKNDKNKIINSVFLYLMEGDPDSDLLIRLRSASVRDLIKVPFSLRHEIKGYIMGEEVTFDELKSLMEDGDGGAAMAASAASLGGPSGPGGAVGGEMGGIPSNGPAVSGSGTTANNIGALPMKFKNGKIIKRIKRSWFPKKIKRKIGKVVKAQT
jgi:hypothetical protein